MGEALRLDRVAVESYSLDRLDADSQFFREAAHQIGVAPPSAADEPAFRRLGDLPQRGRGGFNREGGESRGAVLVAQSVNCRSDRGERVAVERFRRRPVEI